MIQKELRRRRCVHPHLVHRIGDIVVYFASRNDVASEKVGVVSDDSRLTVVTIRKTELLALKILTF